MKATTTKTPATIFRIFSTPKLGDLLEMVTSQVRTTVILESGLAVFDSSLAGTHNIHNKTRRTSCIYATDLSIY